MNKYWKLILFLILVTLVFWRFYGKYSIKVVPKQTSNVSPTAVVETLPTVTIAAEAKTNDALVDKFGIKMLYKSVENGRSWFSDWNNNEDRKIRSGDRDEFSDEFIVRGNGTVTINGKGVATLNGDSPRMYIYDEERKQKWNNVEVTVYGMRVTESDRKTAQGLVIGARSDHQDSSLDNPCLGWTYYGRILYDGRAVFQKEVVHEGAYSKNMPSDNNKIEWGTKNGEMPANKWIGMKFVVRNVNDDKHVNLELYMDLTEGKDGGDWKKVAEYTDVGEWSQTNTGIDVEKKCGYPASKILLTPGTSVFIRNDLVKEARYKYFSVREI